MTIRTILAFHWPILWAMLCGIFLRTPAWAVIGGTPVSSHKQNQLGIVRIESEVGLCTGVLVSEKSIATAAHCVMSSNELQSDSPKTEVFRRFEIHFSVEFDSSSPWIAHRALVHADYISGTFSDVALIELDQSAPQETQAASLRKVDLKNRSFIGYGHSWNNSETQSKQLRSTRPLIRLNDHLNQSQWSAELLNMVERAISGGVLSSRYGSESFARSLAEMNDLTAIDLYTNPSQSISNGDSGGPVYSVDSKNNHQWVGLISGFDQSFSNSMTQFLDLSKHRVPLSSSKEELNHLVQVTPIESVRDWIQTHKK